MANHEAVVTEDDLELAFKDDPKFGLELLHADFRAQIWRYIKSFCRSLSPEDIADIYQNAMVELVRIVKEPDFDPTRPMRIVNKVVKEKTIDFCRRESLRQHRSLDEILPFIAHDLEDTKIGYSWNWLTDDEKLRFQQAVDAAIDGLPPKQKAAAVAYVDVYGEIRKADLYKVLADRISEMTGEIVNGMQAKTNWHEARAKLAEKLSRAGFKALLEG